MKRFLILFVALVCLAAFGATVIQWYHQQPHATAINDGDFLAVENAAPPSYKHVLLSELRAYTGGTNSNPNPSGYFITNHVYVLVATNVYTTNAIIMFITNAVEYTETTFSTNNILNNITNDLFVTTTEYVTNSYTVFQTNYLTVSTTVATTNAYVLYFTNVYGWITNIVNENLTNVILQSSNVYITNIVTAKTAYITNLTVINTLTANMDALTNSDGYVGAAMADTNWVLSQIANLGSYVYFLGPTNTFAITNSSESVSRTNIWKGSLVPYVTAATQTVSGLVLNAYVRHVISTNTFSAIEAGPISITSYPFRTGAAGTVSGHWEIYWVDTVSNIMHEIAAAPTQIIASTAPVFTQTSLTLTNGYTFTNKAYIACAFRLDSIGSGGPSLSWAYGGDYDAHLTFTRPLSSATINASQIVGIITNEVDTAGTVTATAYKVYTNSWAGATNSIDLTYGWVKYLAYTPCSVTGLTGKGSTGKKVQNTLLTITNAASTNITLYYTGTIRTGDGARSWTITNACEGVLSLEFDPNDSTNAVFRMFY